MTPQNSESLLLQMLHDGGVTPIQPDPWIAWTIFKQFALIPIDCARDCLFFQVGDPEHNRDGYFDFVRELELRGARGDEPVWFEQVHIEFKVLSPSHLGVQAVHCFSDDFPDYKTFFSVVEQLPEFRIGLAFRKFVLSVYHTGV